MGLKRQQSLKRFIPTCVGNITGTMTTIKEATVHPHVCGEHFFYLSPVYSMSGSSPRVWGTCLKRPERLTQTRFIPTCVGNILDDMIEEEVKPVHPHVCGEHMQSLFAKTYAAGSSPRVWGTFFFSVPLQSQCRFIPTCVGNILIKSI